jgi:FkbM family methyltransferase
MIDRALRKAIDRVPALAAVVKSARVQHLVQTARGARVVREPLRFAMLQLVPSRAARYRLRASGLDVFLRHRTRDVHILNEIFGGTGGRNGYDPPEALAAAIDANPAPKVLDLGANIGLFGAYVLGRWPRAAIRSFEPDPTNLRLLTRTIAANELERRWSVADVAVANRAGEMSFAAGLFADSHLATSEAGRSAHDASANASCDGAVAPESPTPAVSAQTITVRTVDIFEQDHDVDLMKMDIEGGEWSILTDARLSELRADVLVLEWHARGCPEPDARATTVRLLRDAGYSRLEEVESGHDNGVLWAWRESGSPV